MKKGLTAIVIGAGFAGEGHTRALQHCGVEVVALCARQPEIVRAMTDKLGVEIASTDWHATLEEARPDIVAIGTPANVRREIIEATVAKGCHLFCDKPLRPRQLKRRRSASLRKPVASSIPTRQRIATIRAWPIWRNWWRRERSGG